MIISYLYDYIIYDYIIWFIYDLYKFFIFLFELILNEPWVQFFIHGEIQWNTFPFMSDAIFAVNCIKKKKL